MMEDFGGDVQIDILVPSSTQIVDFEIAQDDGPKRIRRVYKIAEIIEYGDSDNS